MFIVFISFFEAFIWSWFFFLSLNKYSLLYSTFYSFFKEWLPKCLNFGPHKTWTHSCMLLTMLTCRLTHTQEHTQKNGQGSRQRSHSRRKNLGRASYLQLLLGELSGPCPVFLGTLLQKCPFPPPLPTHMHLTSSGTLQHSHHHFPPPRLIPTASSKRHWGPVFPKAKPREDWCSASWATLTLWGG